MLWTFVHSLADATPDLQELRIQATLSSSSAYSLSKIRNLRSLDLYGSEDVVDRKMFMSLGSLGHLVRLSVWMGNNNPHIALDKATRLVTEFPALEELDISGTSLNHLRSLMDTLQAKALRCLSICVGSVPPSDLWSAPNMAEWNSFFKFLVQKLPKSLRSLEVGYHVYSRDVAIPDPGSSVYWMFEPLLELLSLEFMRFRHILGMAFDDTEIRQIAKAWPFVKTLHFPSVGVKPIATYEALLSLASFCTNLTSLTLPFDANVLPSQDLPALSHRLSTLDVGFSPASDPVHVARYLGQLFPNVSVSSGSGGPSKDIWTQVHHLLPTLRASMGMQSGDVLP